MTILFGERLRALRKERNLKQNELAKAIDGTQRKISYWEQGKCEPDLQSLWKLSDFFDVSLDYLVGKTDY